MRVFVLPEGGSAREKGRAHGAAFAGEINALADLRTHLTRVIGGFDSDLGVLECAAQHVPVLRDFDDESYQELIGIAEGADTTAERIVVLNHYTDLRDLGRISAVPADGCSILWARTDSGAIAGQTWDMHASAMPFVIMLRDPGSDDRPGSWTLSITGCLGMAGVSDQGVMVLINNLTSTDAQVGVVWSALVRKALREPDAMSARRVIAGAPVGSGHHYLAADKDSALALETSGERRANIDDPGDGPYVHTNHCLVEAIAERSVVAPTSSTHARYDQLCASLADRPLVDLDDAWQRLGSTDGFPTSISSYLPTPERPHLPATCGAIACNLTTGDIYATGGLTHAAMPHRFRVGEGLVGH